MGPGTEERFGITQFAGTNFSNWKFRVEILLRKHNVAHCLTEETPSETAAKAAFIGKDATAIPLLVQCVADSHLEYVKDATTARAIWERLCSTFEPRGTSNKLFLLKKMLTLKFMEEEETMENFLIRFDDLVRKTKVAGCKLEEEMVACLLLLTLPESYNVVVTAIETLSDDKINVDFVRRRILDEVAKRECIVESTTSNKSMNVDAAAFESSTLTCYYCKKPGHKKFQCRKYKADQNRSKKKGNYNRQQANWADDNGYENEDGDHIAFLTSEQTPIQQSWKKKKRTIKWFLDSDSTDHLINDKSLLSRSKHLLNNILIGVAKSNLNMCATHIGEIDCSFNSNSNICKFTNKDVLFVPKLRRNLLSAGKIEKAGMEISMNNGKVTIKNKGSVVASGIRNGNLYELIFDIDQKRPNSDLSAPTTNMCSNDNTSLWHRRLGHLSDNYMKKLSKIVDGLNIGKDCSTSGCSVCTQGKQSANTFNGTRTRAKRPLQLVHTDVCGPITPTSWSGERYYVSFIDDFTHFAIVYPIKEKSDTFNKLKIFEALATAHFGTRMSKLRCDNGGEYTSKALKEFCEGKGIEIQYTSPYCPQQNGHAERLNRTLCEKGRSLLIEGNLPKEMWNEAIQTAAYLLNRSYTTALNNVTPAELWFGSKPDISNLRVFGCKAYLLKPNHTRNKFDEKSELFTLIGYNNHGYRLWDPKNKRIINGRNIKFDETNKANGLTQVFMESDQMPEARKIEQAVDYQHEIVTSAENNENHYDSDTDLNKTLIKPSTRPKRETQPPVWTKDYYTAHTSTIENIGEPFSYEEAINGNESAEWEQAMKEEINSLNKNHTWSLVKLPEGKKAIGCKWTFKIKKDANGRIHRYKARLVAKGYAQTHGVDYYETYSPVTNITTIRSLLAIANNRKMHIHQMDVHTAFLNGVLDEEVYMCQPEGYGTNTNLVCQITQINLRTKTGSSCMESQL